MEIPYLIEDINPPQSKKAVVIVGRFQPPTIGHYKVIDRAKKFIRESKHLELYSQPILVIIAGKKTSDDKKKNPLTIEERRYFLQHSGKANGIKILDASNAFEAFNAVREAGFEPFVVAAGSDRVDGYVEMLDSAFLDKSGKPQKHFKISGLDRDEVPANEKTLEQMKKENDIDSAEVSGSLARRAVELDYFDEFVSITGLEKNIPAAKKLFKLIKTRGGE